MIKTLRDINKGEEIFIKYEDEYWTKPEDCLCLSCPTDSQSQMKPNRQYEASKSGVPRNSKVSEHTMVEDSETSMKLVDIRSDTPDDFDNVAREAVDILRKDVDFIDLGLSMANDSA